MKAPGKIFAILFLTFLMFQCSSSDNTRVIINTGLTKQKHEISAIDKILMFFSSDALAEAPSNLETLGITVTGPGMDEIYRSFSPDTSVITLDVPSGEDRLFIINASGEQETYTGSARTNLSPGETKNLSIRMQLVRGTTFSVASDPSPTGYDEPSAITVDSDYIYVAGKDLSSGQRWRIEKRDIFTGALETDFGAPNGYVISAIATAEPKAIIQDDTSIYIAGFEGYSSTDWRIEKRSKTTGVLDSSFGTGGAVVFNPGASGETASALAITQDSSSIYISGEYYDANTNYNWLVEKRLKTTGALSPVFFSGETIYMNLNSNMTPVSASALVLDGNDLYAAGNIYTATNEPWRIEKIDATTGDFTSGWATSYTAGLTDKITTMTYDDDSIYIGGYDQTGGDEKWRIEKYIKSSGAKDTAFGSAGVVISDPGTFWEILTSVKVDSDYIYLAGYENTDGEYINVWRMEKRNKYTGELVSGFGTEGVVSFSYGTGEEGIQAMTTDNFYIYIAGTDLTPASGAQWRIEKRLKATGGF